MNFFKIYVILLALMTEASCAKKVENGLYRGYEIPAYQVTKKSENIEIRQYEKVLVAEVEVEGKRKEAVKEGFLILARYIFGKNVAKEKVAMTSPVSQQQVDEEKSQKIAMTSPVSQVEQPGQSDSKKWLVQFGMPKAFTIETLPVPKDSRIRFETIPERKVAAITFAGTWSDQQFTDNKEKLKKFIEKNGLKTNGEAIIVYYDDPMTFPWNRRNEVIWEIK